MSQQNTLGTATAGVQVFDGTSVYSGVTGNNGVLISDASGVVSFLAPGTTGQVLIATTSNPPSWGAISSSAVTTLTGTANQVLVNGTSGTPTSGAITLTLPQSIGTGNSPQFIGLNLTGLTASQAVVTDGSKNLASLAYSIASAATSLVERDANQNAFANNFVSKATNVVSATGTTVLTAASARWQNLTGSQPQIFQLPDATTLGIGSIYTFNNNTTNSTLTVKDNSGTTLFTIPFGGQGIAILTVNVSTAGVWDYHFSMPANASWGTSGLTVPATSFVSSGQYKLVGTSSGTISILPQAAAGTYNFNLPTSAGTAGDVLTSGGGSGAPMTWTAAGTGFVTSITGTANQVIASSPTGAVTLSLPQSIATSSNVQFAKLGLGVSPTYILDVLGITNLDLNADGTTLIVRGGTPTGTQGGQILMTNTGSGVATPNKYLRVDGRGLFQIINSAYSSAIISMADNGQISIGTDTPTTSALLTMISTSSGFLPPSMTTTQKNAISSPATGLMVYDNVINDVQFYNGSSWVGTTASGVTSITGTANQIIASSSTGAVTLSTPQNINTGADFRANSIRLNSAAAVTASLFISPIASTAILIQANVTSGSLTSVNTNINYSQSSGTLNLYSFKATDFLITSGTAAISNMVGFHANLAMNSLSTTTFYAGFLGSAITGSPGPITTAYTAYFANPGAGTSKAALYADDGSIGYTAITPPTNGLIVSGSVSIGSSTAAASALLSVVSTTKGFLPPSMTTTQKNAISSPAAGLTVYDNVLLDLQFYNGTSWIGASGSGVTSITGTANQVIASASTGAVTLSLPQSIATTSIVQFGKVGIGVPAGNLLDVGGGVAIGAGYAGSIGAPTNGMIIQGNVSIGSGSPPAGSGLYVVPALSTSAPTDSLYGASVSPTMTYNSGATGAFATAFFVQGTSVVNAGASLSSQTGIFINPITKSGAGSGPVNAYGLVSFKPSIGTTANIGIFTDSFSIGYTTVSPPSNGMIVSGIAGFGTSSPNAAIELTVVPSSSSITVGVNVAGSFSGSSQIGIYSNSTYSNASSVAQSILSSPKFAAAAATSITSASCFYASPFYTGNAGTITTSYGYIYDGGASVVGTVTTAYGAYFVTPAAGTTKIALYADNAALGTGYVGIAPPSNGLIVQGNVSIGSSSTTSQFNVGSSNQFQVNSSGDTTISTSANSQAPTLAIRNTNAGASALTQFQMGNDLSATEFVIFTTSTAGSGNTKVRTKTNLMILGANNTDQMYFNGTSIGIYQAAPDLSAAIHVTSTSQGVRFPNMTTTQKNAISSPGAGLVIFDVSLSKLCVYSGTSWETITSV